MFLENIQLRHGGTRRNPGATILRNVSLSVPDGAFRWLTGPSGAGKSSLLSLLHLSMRPAAGRMEIFGVAPDRASRGRLARMRRRIGLIPQDYRLLGELSVLDNVVLPLRIARQSERDSLREARAILDWLGLDGREDVLPDRLSGGERQRVAIARALVTRPDLLLADEPTNALGEEQARGLIGLFQHLAHSGATVIVATHNATLLRDFPARTFALDGGHIREETPDP
nr:ATP-binding cassette domain-containing protein [Acidomonas methanolica]